ARAGATRWLAHGRLVRGHGSWELPGRRRRRILASVEPFDILLLPRGLVAAGGGCVVVRDAPTGAGHDPGGSAARSTRRGGHPTGEPGNRRGRELTCSPAFALCFPGLSTMRACSRRPSCRSTRRCATICAIAASRRAG